MGEPNFANRTLWIGDNLDILRGIDSGCVNLIYLDPPFNSRRLFNAPLGSKAAGAQFEDTWAMDGVKREWADLREHAAPALFHTIVGAGETHGEPMQAYLTFMAPRLEEMRRVLASTGSIYLQCDDTASHYLKQLMDAVFGAARFCNEIVWRREPGTKNSAKRYPRNTDRLFLYAKSSAFTWNAPTEPWTKEQIDKWYTLEDERGRYTRRQLRRPSEGMPEWRGLRHGTGSWNAPKSGHDAEWIEREFIPGYRSIESAAERLDALDAAGLLHWPEHEDGLPSLKKYEKHAILTVPLGDVWADIPGGRGVPKNERTGWPTQKPLALLHRVIKASTKRDDLVLDPFCGCATACIAAEQTKRRWAGIDIDSKAEEITLERLERECGTERGVDISQAGKTATVETLWAQPVTVSDRPPTRSAGDDVPQRTPNSVLRAMLWAQLAVDAGEPDRRVCPPCGRAKYVDDFDLDHIQPRSKGGPDTDDNLQLICGACNTRKGNRLTMTQLRQIQGLPPGTTTHTTYHQLGT